MRFGLLARATLALSAVGLIPLGVVPVLVGLNRDAMTDQVLSLHSVAATSGAERVAAAVEPLQRTAQAAARNPLILADPRSQASRQALAAILQAQPAIAALSVATASGEEFIRVQARATAEVANRLLAEPDASPLAARRVDGRLWLRVEAPLETGDRLRLIADASSLDAVTNPEELGDAAVLALATASGQLIAASSDGVRLDSFPPALVEAASARRIAGAGRFTGPTGEAVLGAQAPVPGTDWYVVSAQPARVAEAVAERMKKRFAVAVGTALALVAAVSAVAYRNVIRPIRELAQAQRRLARGRGPIKSADEIEQLQGAFSDLERQLRDRDAVGQVFLGRYQVLEPLGSGGMGTVFKGYDPKLQRYLALKTVHIERALAREDASEQLSSLLHEAVTVARFSHPNIVAVYDLEDLPDAAFVAMEFVDGRSLERHLGDTRVLEPSQVAPLGAAIARGLAAAHAQGVVHRDIKPANVLLGRDGSIKIADFGIAGALSRLAQESDMVWGTPGYLPPESLRGEGQTDKGDLFALGAMLHECLVGANPFEGRDPDEMVRRTIEEEVPPLRLLRADVPADLEALVTSLLQKEPARRPESANAVAERLEQLAQAGGWRWIPAIAPDEAVTELPSRTFSMMLRREGSASRAEGRKGEQA